MAYAAVFTALADPTRRRILEALRRQPKTVGQLAAGGPVSRPAVSQHLKVLQAARLVTVQPQGNRRLYSINAMDWMTCETTSRPSGPMSCLLMAPRSCDA